MGLRSSPWQHLDDTATRVNGDNQHCHVVCNPLYTAFFTTASQDRLRNALNNHQSAVDNWRKIKRFAEGGRKTDIEVDQARQKVLEADHYGLEKVKQRILEYLAVRKLRQERKNETLTENKDEIRRLREGVILCFIGPPGVGKTSLGRSIRLSLAALYDKTSGGGAADSATS
jgi:Holliday junction resolvasome RuvABC ATP-dependent DNA helicase subunit